MTQRNNSMHHVSLSVVLLSSAAMAGDWVTLFDGTSLDGWRAAENPKAFTVKDETLVVNGERGHLFWSGKTVKIENGTILNLRPWCEPSPRTVVSSSIPFQNTLRCWLRMPGKRHPRRQHQNLSLYGIVNNNMPPHVDGDWVKLRIRVAGRHIQTSIDNQVVIDWWEPKDRKGSKKLSTGTFAIQAHDPKSVVEYKFIKARHLDPKEMTRAERLDMRISMQAFRKRMAEPNGPRPLRLLCDGYPMDYATANKGLNLFLENGWVASLIPVYCELRYGKVAWTGKVSYNGSHGGHPAAVGTPIYGSLEGPGWKVNDLGKILAEAMGTASSGNGSLGRTDMGEESILNYTVGQARVLNTTASNKGNWQCPGSTLEVFQPPPRFMHVRVADATRDQRIKVLLMDAGLGRRHEICHSGKRRLHL